MLVNDIMAMETKHTLQKLENACGFMTQAEEFWRYSPDMELAIVGRPSGWLYQKDLNDPKTWLSMCLASQKTINPAITGVRVI